MSLIHPHLLLSSLGLRTEALADQMIGAVIDTDHAHQWAVAEVATRLLHLTITMTVAALLEATVPAAMTTAAARRPRASSMTGAKGATDARRPVVACPMSMAHRVRATLTILTMPGPDPLHAATMILT